MSRCFNCGESFNRDMPNWVRLRSTGGGDLSLTFPTHLNTQHVDYRVEAVRVRINGEVFWCSFGCFAVWAAEHVVAKTEARS